MKKILIAGIGNILMTDDGLGVFAAKELQGRISKFGVKIIDIGNSLPNLFYWMKDTENLIAIDAIRGEKEPGTIYRIDALTMKKTPYIFRDSHGDSLLETIALSREFWNKPEKAIIYGLQPKDCSRGVGLSTKVEKAMINMLKAIENEVELILTKDSYELPNVEGENLA